MPEGIYKTNGRIEATQVDVAAKYPGRQATSPSGEEARSRPGQVVGRISSPEYEAQSCVRRNPIWTKLSPSAWFEAETLIDQRKAVLAAAKSDFERGQELVGKQIITQQTFDQRRRNFESAEASVAGAVAQREQADAAIKERREAEEVRAASRRFWKDLVLILAADRTGAIPAGAQRRSGSPAAGKSLFLKPPSSTCTTST